MGGAGEGVRQSERNIDIKQETAPMLLPRNVGQRCSF